MRGGGCCVRRDLRAQGEQRQCGWVPPVRGVGARGAPECCNRVEGYGPHCAQVWDSGCPISAPPLLFWVEPLHPPALPMQCSHPQAQLRRLPRIFPRTTVSFGCQVKIERLLIIFCFQENTGGTWRGRQCPDSSFPCGLPSPDPFLSPTWAGMGLKKGEESIHQQMNKTK